MNFVEKWHRAQQINHSRLAIGLAPRLVNMPAPIMRYDDPFLPFGRAIIEATRDLACAYIFDLASYLAIGAAGARALERTIPLVPNDIPRVLHGPFITPDYAAAAFDEAFAADAVTLLSEDSAVVLPYVKDERHGAFVKNTTLRMPNLGTYSDTSFELGNIQVRWVTDPIIYASGRMDFEQQVRAAAEKYREFSDG